MDGQSSGGMEGEEVSSLALGEMDAPDSVGLSGDTAADSQANLRYTC